MFDHFYKYISVTVASSQCCFSCLFLGKGLRETQHLLQTLNLSHWVSSKQLILEISSDRLPSTSWTTLQRGLKAQSISVGGNTRYKVRGCLGKGRSVIIARDGVMAFPCSISERDVVDTTRKVAVLGECRGNPRCWLCAWRNWKYRGRDRMCVVVQLQRLDDEENICKKSFVNANLGK